MAWFLNIDKLYELLATNDSDSCTFVHRAHGPKSYRFEVFATPVDGVAVQCAVIRNGKIVATAGTNNLWAGAVSDPDIDLVVVGLGMESDFAYPAKPSGYTLIDQQQVYDSGDADYCISALSYKEADGGDTPASFSATNVKEDGSGTVGIGGRNIPDDPVAAILALSPDKFWLFDRYEYDGSTILWQDTGATSAVTAAGQNVKAASCLVTGELLTEATNPPEFTGTEIVAASGESLSKTLGTSFTPELTMYGWYPENGGSTYGLGGDIDMNVTTGDRELTGQYAGDMSGLYSHYERWGLEQDGGARTLWIDGEAHAIGGTGSPTLSDVELLRGTHVAVAYWETAPADPEYVDFLFSLLSHAEVLSYDDTVTNIGDVFARYKMDEASGDIIDVGPNGLDGVATGTPDYSQTNAQLTDGGTGIAVNSVSEYFTLGTASDWDQLHTTPEWTFAAWVTWTKGSNQLDVVWGNTTSGTHHGAAVWLDNRVGQDKIVVVSSGDGSTQVGSCPDSVVTSGVPFFLVATCSTTSGGMKIYIDGVDETTVTGTAVAKVGTANNPMVLGSVGGSETTFEFNGQIDDVTIFERALTPYEIADLYAAGTA